MRRARFLLLLLLVPGNAASLWALPRCEMVVVCHMGPDGGSCCPAGDNSMEGCKDSGPAATLVLLPAAAPAAPPRLAGLVPLTSVAPAPGERLFPVTPEVLTPPPRG